MLLSPEATQEFPFSETQVHILVGCADARDVGQVHIDAVRAVQGRYKEQGVRVRFHTLRVPGAFITDDVLADLRQIATMTEQDVHAADHPLRYFVHIQAHGALEDDTGGGCYSGTTTSLRIEAGSPLNCGMLGATGVAVEMERLILAARPTVALPEGNSVTVGSEDELRAVLREVYGYDGYLAGDWVRSIDDLRTHARAQKTKLERALAVDPDLRRLAIHVTAGIQDYRHHRQVRLDCGDVEARFWDEVHEFIHARAAAGGTDVPDFAAQAEKQKPVGGLFALDEPSETPRGLVGTWYARRKGLPDASYQPNRLFVLGGSAFDRPRTPFGPYVLAGFYYAAEHLNLKEWVVTGRNAAQTARMVAKIHGDPFMALFVRELGVTLLPVSAEELLAESA